MGPGRPRNPVFRRSAGLLRGLRECYRAPMDDAPKPAFRPLDALPPDPEDLPDTLPRRPIWPWLLVLVAVLAGGGYLAYRVATAPDARKVLVVVDLDGKWWEGSLGAAALADSLSGRLEAMGFQVVRGGDPEVTDILESERDPQRAAARLRAAWLVVAELSVSESELPIDGGFVELRAEGPVRVLHADAPPALSPTVSSWAGAKKKDDARRLLGEALADRVFDAALPLLVEHPRLRDVFQAGVASPDAVLADKLRPAREYVEQRTQTLADATRKYAETAVRREKAEGGPVPVRFHSDAAAADGLCGMGPAGALVKTEDAPLFFLPERRTLGRISALESVVWMSPEGERKTLWTGYNLYGYPTLGADGASAVIVEDLFGWAKTVTVATADGKANRLRVDPTHRYSGGRLAPGNGMVAIQDRASRDCPEALLVLDATEGAEVVTLMPEDGAFGGWLWLDATHLAVLYTPGKAQRSDALFTAPGPATTLYSVALGAGAPSAKALVTAEPEERFAWLSATPDAQHLAFEINRAGDDQIGVFDVAAGTLARLSPGVGCSAPSIAPDGKAVAFQWIDARGGDEEVGVMVVGAEKALRLTDNTARDRYPQFDRAGTRIYFESLADDPNFKDRRKVSRIASVPFEPPAP